MQHIFSFDRLRTVGYKNIEYPMWLKKYDAKHFKCTTASISHHHLHITKNDKYNLYNNAYTYIHTYIYTLKNI